MKKEEFKDYLIEVKVKNNLLYKMVYEKHTSVESFCKEKGVSSSLIHRLLNFKQPLFYKGKYSANILLLVDKLGCEIKDIIPPSYWERDFNHFKLECSEEEMLSFSSPKDVAQLVYNNVDPFDIKDKKDKITKLLNTLTPREERVIRSLYLEDKKLTDVAEDLGVGLERIRQLERKALDKLNKRINLIKENINILKPEFM